MANVLTNGPFGLDDALIKVPYWCLISNRQKLKYLNHNERCLIKQSTQVLSFNNMKLFPPHKISCTPPDMNGANSVAFPFALVPSTRERRAAPCNVIMYGNTFVNALFQALTTYILMTPPSFFVDIIL